MSENIQDIEVKTINGEDKKLGDYAGNVLLIVNVASACGYTPQYAGLEKLNRQYAAQGLKVLGFPSNDFGGQEPGTEAEIQTFCSTKYDVTFDLFKKVHAKGSDQAPLYQYLTSHANPTGEVQWNFEKFLVSKDGQVVGRYRSNVAPESQELVAAIQQELAK